MELYHHGIKGMKWGVRRYQNYDGSLKAAGQRHREQLNDGSTTNVSKSQAKKTAKTLSRLGKKLH